MGKFAELCKGRTMGAFFLLLLPAGAALHCVAKDQAWAAVELLSARHTRGGSCMCAPRACDSYPRRQALARRGRLPSSSSPHPV